MIKLRKNRVLFIITIISILIIIEITCKKNYSKAAYNQELYKYAKEETLLRTAANSSAEIEIVVVKGTKVKCTSSVVKGDGTIYDEVEIIPDNNYKEGHKGYILRRQLTTDMVDQEERLIYIKNKTMMVREAMRILNTNTRYNLKAPYRVGGYYNIIQEGQYVYDCSSFCSTLMNRTFGLNLLKYNDKNVVLNGKQYYNIWTTYSYFDEVNKNNSMFRVVDRVTTYGQSIDKSKLQIGDFILGDAQRIKNGVNHIMFYMGDDYIIHATNGGVKRERLSTDYYTCLENASNVASGNYTRRFDKEIMIIRYRDRELN